MGLCVVLLLAAQAALTRDAACRTLFAMTIGVLLACAISANCRRALRSRGTSLVGVGRGAFDRVPQGATVDRLGQEVVHACGEATLSILRSGARGEGDHR